MGTVTTLFCCGIIADKESEMTIRYAMKQYGRKTKRNGIAFAAVAADIFRAVDGFEFINTRFSLHAKTAK